MIYIVPLGFSFVMYRIYNKNIIGLNDFIDRINKNDLSKDILEIGEKLQHRFHETKVDCIYETDEKE